MPKISPEKTQTLNPNENKTEGHPKSADLAKPFTIFIRNLITKNSSIYCIEAESEADTFFSIKEQFLKIAKLDKIRHSHLFFTHRGTVLGSDQKSLSDYGIEQDSTVTASVSIPGGPNCR